MAHQQVDQWDLVIKVKYGDTLRRIGACVHGQLMDHNMSKLRAKIISLFKFSHDVGFILTYTDEDGDTVTLDDDDELRDAVIGQHLNPLRINVQLKSTENTDARFETSSPANSPQLESLPTVNEQPKSTLEPLLGLVSNLVSIAEKAIASSPAVPQKVDEVMYSEPFRSAMANLSKDVKKAFSPTLAQVVEQISNLGLSNASQTSGPTGEASGGSSAASTHQMYLDVADEPKASYGLIAETTELPSYKTSFVKQNTSVKQGAGATVPSVDLNKDAPKDAIASMYTFEDLLASMCTATTCSENFCGKSVASTSGAFPPVNQAPRSENFWTPVQQYPTYGDGSANIMGGGSSNKQSPMEAHTASPVQTGFNSHSEVPISRQVGPPPSDVFSTPWGCPMLHSHRRSHIYNENTSRTFHTGVQCDGCGMHPIVGPRFKSNVKEDYDLCNICFTQMGNETDYTRIDHSPHRAPHSHSRYRFPSSNVIHDFGVRPARAKLESRFIQDVTVLDGTLMPPSTHFTKIWRLRNSGTVAWPFGTQLVWVGGDQFGDRLSTNLEIPVNGFPIDKELDVAVDFTAPSRPGRYVSYWKMASPSGQKFGQRVWVLIQVDYSRPTSAAGSSFHSDLNLNLPPESSGPNGLGVVDVNTEPLDGGFPETNVTSDINVTRTFAGLVESVVENAPVRLVEQPAQLVGGLLVDACNVSPRASYPLIDLHATPSMADASLVAAAVADDNTVEQNNPVEQTLLKELEEMGFKQIDLNKEVLRLNEYDLARSVDDLCGFAEWDPLLSELQEMGFEDKELNKKLLIKNGGSIERVVLDLIAGMVE